MAHFMVKGGGGGPVAGEALFVKEGRSLELGAGGLD
jgi:hypothetical protein